MCEVEVVESPLVELLTVWNSKVSVEMGLKYPLGSLCYGKMNDVVALSILNGSLLETPELEDLRQLLLPLLEALLSPFASLNSSFLPPLSL